jgi:hypothetical protein
MTKNVKKYAADAKSWAVVHPVFAFVVGVVLGFLIKAIL